MINPMKVITVFIVAALLIAMFVTGLEIKSVNPKYLVGIVFLAFVSILIIGKLAGYPAIRQRSR